MIAAGPTVTQRELRGPIAELTARFRLRRPPSEALIEGPAGAGKTLPVLTLIDWLAWEFPGIRIMIVRKVRADLAVTTLRTLEEEVFGEHHPCMQRTLSAANRREYRYPNGSVLLLQGLDKSSRTFGSQVDVIYVNEAIELTLDDYELLLRSMRNALTKPRIVDPVTGEPHAPILLDCNPTYESHWLNRRAERLGPLRMPRYMCRHEHNPSIYLPDMVTPTPAGRSYLAKLDLMTGHRYQRMRLGLWVSAEGVIWPSFDRRVHVLDAEARGVPTQRRPWGRNLWPIEFYVGAIDWGRRNPGVFQLWGIGRQEIAPGVRDIIAYRLMEWYRRDWGLDTWADRIQEVHRKYPMRAIAADPADPNRIEHLNIRLGARERREVGQLVVGADNSGAGRDLVEDLLNPARLGGPRIYLLDNALQEPDTGLIDAGKPHDTESEIPAYRWAEARDGQPEREEPDKTCADHGCDTLRYLSTYVWKGTMPKLSRPELVVEEAGDLDDMRLLGRL